MKDNSHCVINLSSLSSSSSDDFEDFMMLLHVYEYDEIFLEKMPQRTSSLRREDFVMSYWIIMKGHVMNYFEWIKPHFFKMIQDFFWMQLQDLKINFFMAKMKVNGKLI